MNRLSSIASLVICSIIVSGIIQSVNATDWVEVTRWSGSAFPDLEEFSMQFECSHIEWRIVWSYDAVGSPFESILIIQKSGDLIVYSESYFSKSGARSIHNEAGNFSLEITCLNMYEYLIIVEQDVDSIPEFPSYLILPLFMISTLLAVILYRRKHST